MILNAVSLIFLIFVVAFLLYVLYFLGGLPGKTAGKRHHPQADAIKILGWLGLFTGGIVWCVALVWAYYYPTTLSNDANSGDPLPAETNTVHAPDNTANLSHGA